LRFLRRKARVAEVDKGDELKVADPGVVELDKADPDTTEPDVTELDVADPDVVDPDVAEVEMAEFDFTLVSFSSSRVTSL